jgi:hypothetical protein
VDIDDCVLVDMDWKGGDVAVPLLNLLTVMVEEEGKGSDGGQANECKVNISPQVCDRCRRWLHLRFTVPFTNHDSFPICFRVCFCTIQCACVSVRTWTISVCFTIGYVCVLVRT